MGKFFGFSSCLELVYFVLYSLASRESEVSCVHAGYKEKFTGTHGSATACRIHCICPEPEPWQRSKPFEETFDPRNTSTPRGNHLSTELAVASCLELRFHVRASFRSTLPLRYSLFVPIAFSAADASRSRLRCGTNLLRLARQKRGGTDHWNRPSDRTVQGE